MSLFAEDGNNAPEQAALLTIQEEKPARAAAVNPKEPDEAKTKEEAKQEEEQEVTAEEKKKTYETEAKRLSAEIELAIHVSSDPEMKVEVDEIQ